MAAKIIFIAHPISGDIEGNIKKVLQICRIIHSKKIIPFFPSLIWRQYLGDSVEDKELIDRVNQEFFTKGTVDEVWFYGNKFSEGMRGEALLAMKHGIPVCGKSLVTKQALLELSKQVLLHL